MFGPGAKIDQPCDICGKKQLLLEWTLAHGHAQCIYCHAPYVVLFYEDGKLVRRDDPPECNIQEQYVELYKRCWNELQLPFTTGEVHEWFEKNEAA